MHHCLRISEIFQHICDKVDGKPGSRKSREYQLYSLALTCRDFQQTALAGLWEVIASLEPLVKCAGRDTWEIDNRSRKLYFSHFPTSSDLETIKKYAALVKTFGVKDHYYSPHHVSSIVWKIFKIVFKETVLFSNLRVLHIDTTHRRYISLFPMQTLTHVVSLDSSSLEGLSDNLAQCHNLTSVRLGLVSYKEQEKDLIVAASNWPKLSRFVSASASYGLLQTLSQHSSSLKVLKVANLDSRDCPQHPMGTNTLVYPALQELRVGFQNCSQAIRFVSCLSPHISPKILDFSFDDPPQSREENWLQLLRSTKQYSRSLKRLVIGDCVRGCKNPALVLPGARILAAVTTDFTHLNHIELSNLGGFVMTDGDLEQLTEALPRLGACRLTNGIPYPPRITHDTTIASLVHFARNCPKLTHLSLDFDARVDKLPGHSTFSERGLRLTVLNVQSSPLDNPERITRILCTLFPNLENIKSDYFSYRDKADAMEHETYFKPWTEVCELLEVDKKERLGLMQNTTISPSPET